MQKLVSVIIPTYNRAHSVVDAVMSVKTQDYPAIQIIVVDDGSKDKTAELIEQIENVEYYYQENKGQGAARNLGLKYAQGDYVASLDSDDIWHRDFLSNAVNRLEKHDLDFVFLNWLSMDGKETLLDFWNRSKKWKKFVSENDDDWFLFDSQQLRNLFLEACPSPSSSLLLRRSSLVAEWNEKMIAADDWYFMLELVLSKPCRAAFTLSPHWTKRVFGDNIYDGRNILELTKNGLHDDLVMEQDLESHLTKAEKQIFQKRLALNRLNFGRLKWKNDNISKNVFLNVYKAFRLAPISVSFHIVEIFISHIKHQIKTNSSDDNLKKK